MNRSNDRSTLSYYLAAIHMPGVGPRTLMRWLEVFGSLDAVFHESVTGLKAAGIPEKHIASLKQPDWEIVEKTLSWATEKNHHLILWGHPDYPGLLKTLPDAPPVLFVRGDKRALIKTQLAVIGARNASPRGCQNAEAFAYTLAEAGLTITSGLALGIDGASHRGALHAKGVTIAVMGTGLNQIYPASHRLLAEEIVGSQGAIVSEFPLEALPFASHFPRRNRIISGLSVGVLVVEAAMKSGSLTTAAHALEQGREVFAIPGSIHNPLSRGCHHLIRQGAKLVETAQDILEELKMYSISNKNEQKHIQPKIAPDEDHVMTYIGEEIITVDELIIRCGLTSSKISALILSLELQGYIQQVPGGYVKLK